jgi:hypothetical protein
MMKSACLIPLTFILPLCFFQYTGCKDHPTEMNAPSEQISFSTEKYSYSTSDTVNLFLKNGSKLDISVGMRCGVYLEMYYQQKDKDNWGDTLWFPYMTFRCLTQLESVAANTTFTHSLPAQNFYSTGTFRLLLRGHFVQQDSAFTVVSNTFEIRQ